MKELQDNFTTVEQSKRLIELGVPVDSADCTWRRTITDGGFSEYTTLCVESFRGTPDEIRYMPIWTVGRLIEILHITYKQDWREYLYMCTTETCKKGLVNQIMQYL